MHTHHRLKGLEATRFVAALMIILFHIVHIPRLAIPDWLSFIGKYLGMGVPLFYLVSAFGLFLGYLGRTSSTEGLREYFLRRFFRIAPLFYVMMMLYGVYFYLHYNKVVPPIEYLTSALFLFNFVPQHVQGFVWASWSIGVEMAFYVILPVLLFAVTSLWRALFFLAISLILSWLWVDAFAGAEGALKNFGNFSLVAYTPYFLVGIVTYFVWRRLEHYQQAPRILWTSIGLLAALVAFDSLILRHTGVVLFKTMLTAAGAGLVLGLVKAPTVVLVNTATVKLGKASFSLYLWHPLVISVLTWSGVYHWIYVVFIDGPAYILSAALTLLILAPIALLSYRYIEVPGMRFGDRVINRPNGIALTEPAPS